MTDEGEGRKPPPLSERIRAILIAAGLSLPKPPPVPGQLTPEQRDALAQRIGPLSQIIIEERQDR